MDGSTTLVSQNANIPLSTCCTAGAEQQSDELIEGACEQQITVAFENNQCTETEDFVDPSGAVVLTSTQDEDNHHCCQEYTWNGDEDLRDACEMTETFDYPQHDQCTMTTKFFLDGAVVSQFTESYDTDICCQEYSETAENAGNLLNACSATATYQYTDATCTSTTEFTTVAGEVVFTSTADHEAAECCWWGQE